LFFEKSQKNLKKVQICTFFLPFFTFLFIFAVFVRLKKPLTDVKVVQNVEPGETNGSKVAIFDMQCEDASGARLLR
jgi:hypothetical protein